MTAVLAFDTATDATVVALARSGRDPVEAWHTPGEGERPGHAQQLLPLVRDVLERAGIGFGDVARIGVGTGPGTFTGLRIGVATARALAQSSGAELAGVSTLMTLAAAAFTPVRDGPPAGPAGGAQAVPPEHHGPVLSVLDARRGEAFVAAYAAGERGLPRTLRPAAAAPPEELGEWLAQAAGPWLAVGEGAVRFRELLEAAGAAVPADGSPLHRVSAIALCGLAVAAEPVERDALIPEYVRAPDAELRREP
jgi:tRNA threonylcarbamoyladenosine biosynthesis protein TsaB